MTSSTAGVIGPGLQDVMGQHSLACVAVTDSPAPHRAWVVTTVLAVPLATLIGLVAARLGELMWLDRTVTSSWYDAASGTTWSSFFQHVATITHPRYVAGVMVLVAIALAVRRWFLTAAWVAAVIAGSAITTRLLKHFVGRSRPDIPDQIGGWSFPSAHSVQIAVAAGILIVLTCQHVHARRVRIPLVTLWLAIAVLVGLDRIFVGAHFPSDVVAGWLLGAVYVLIGAAAFRVIDTGRRSAPPRPLSSVPEHRRTLAVILNPIRVDSDAFRARLGRAVRQAGWDEPLWFETTVDDAGASMARAAVAAGADVVVAAGGDGTVRVVCSEMAGSGVPVGVVPAGTGNLLARNLKIPLTEDEAVQTILHGQDHAIDLVGIEGDDLAPTRFAVMAGMGLDAAIMAGAPDSLKRRMGWSAYFVAGAKHLRYPALKVAISVDDAEPVQRRARTVVVGNVGTLTAGIPLLPDARIDDGKLDVVVVAPRRLVGWVGLVWRVLSRQRRTDERLDRFTGRSVVVSATHPAPRQLDGDIMAPGAEIHARNEHGVLLVRVPR